MDKKLEELLNVKLLKQFYLVSKDWKDFKTLLKEKGYTKKEIEEIADIYHPDNEYRQNEEGNEDS